MKKPAQVKRGELVFVAADRGLVFVTLGEPDSPESERVLEIHESYIKDLIAGLTAITQVRKS